MLDSPTLQFCPIKRLTAQSELDNLPLLPSQIWNLTGHFVLFLPFKFNLAYHFRALDFEQSYAF